MLAVPVAAELFIAQYRLGTPKQIYRPATVTAIIFGSLLTIFAVFWILVVLFIIGVITGGSFFLTNLLSAQTSPFPPDSPFSPATPSINPTLSIILTILGLVFPLFGLLFVAFGITMIVKALLNRHICAVLCEHGVVYIGRRESVAFRWEQVVTVLDKVSVNSSTDEGANGMTSTRTTISHAYTVVCKDGRRFLFDGKLARVEELGQEIQIAVALSRQQTV